MKAEKLVLSSVMLSLTYAGNVMADDAAASEHDVHNDNTKPNIVFIMADDLGWNDLGYTGSDYYESPNIDRLATQGMIFTNAYSAAANSAPSRACFMSGMYTPRHGIYTVSPSDRGDKTKRKLIPIPNTEDLRSSFVTLGEALKEQGYTCGHVGKWHLGDDADGTGPLSQGFDLNIAGCRAGTPYSYFYPYCSKKKNACHPGLDKGKEGEYLTDRLTDEAVKFILDSEKENKPFFLYMAHYAVHAPFHTDKRFIGHYQDDKSKSDQAKSFATLIEGMDKSLGDLMDYLNSKGIAENTLIIFLGDNGGDAPLGPSRGYSSSAPFRGKKGSEFEGGMRVPCIIGWAKPSNGNKFQKKLPIETGGVQSQLGTVMDIYPTLASLSGADIPSSHIVDGHDLSVLLTGEKDPEKEESFLMHFPHSHRGSYFTMYREGDWKLIYYYNPEHPERPDCALYNLKSDPYEHNEVSVSYPDKTRYMLYKMKERLEKEGALYPVDFDGKEIKPNIEFFFK